MERLCENINIRKLELGDYHSGYLDLLNQLTDTPSITFQQFTDKFISIDSNPCFFIYVAVNDKSDILASISILIEPKFIHNASSVCHIEDLVVSKEYRGLGIGKKLVSFATGMAKSHSCYKMILDCSNDNIAFYEKCGLNLKSNQMALYLS